MADKMPGGITGKGFVKGDPRVNRAGRPRTFDALRSLSVQLAHEPALDADGKPVIGPHGKAVTRAELILRDWANSGDFQKQAKFLEYAFGKIPDKLEFSGPDGEPALIPICVVSAQNWAALDVETKTAEVDRTNRLIGNGHDVIDR